MFKKLAKRIQELYREYKELDLISEAAQDAMIKDFENEELEKIADEAYQVFWNKREELVALLMDVCKVDRYAVNKMLASEELEDLMSKKIV